MRILLLSGSVRHDRKSHRLALFLNKELEKRDVEVTFFDLYTHPIPLLEDIYTNLENPGENLKQLKSALDSVDHILIVTPEYNGHFAPGVMNAIDHFKSEYSKKVMGVATASAGKMAGIRASIHIQSYIIALGGYTVPKHCGVPYVGKTIDENGQLLKEDFAKQSDSFLDEFLWLASAVTQYKGAHE